MHMNELIRVIKSKDNKIQHTYYFDYLNFRIDARPPKITREELLLRAWSRTGKHLKKALDDYGEYAKESGQKA